MTKLTGIFEVYRGHYIQESDGKWHVYKGDNTLLATADREQAAYDFVDIERRKARGAGDRPVTT
jgi:hypothetical protein